MFLGRSFLRYTLAVTSSAKAVPAFAQPDVPARAALLSTIQVEVEPIMQRYQDADTLTFPLYAHIALATS